MRKIIFDKLEAFTYLGEAFKPFRQFTKKELSGAANSIGNYTGISSYQNQYQTLRFVTKDYNYNEFYNAAKNVGAEECDIFLWHDKKVIPCGNEVFYLSGEVPYKNEKVIQHEKYINLLEKTIKRQELKIENAKKVVNQLIEELKELKKLI